MSKHRKHRNSSIDASSSGQALPESPAAAGKSLPRRIAWQLLGVLGASVVLGFAFNTSSPVGIRFHDATPEPSPTTLTTESSSSITVAPSAANTPAVSQTTAPPPAPTRTADQPISTRQLTPASPVAPPLPAAPAIATQIPTNSIVEQNPSAIHWLQAKPLVDAGQAVLVDVRAKGMYEAGHIPGAFSLPEASSPEEFTAFLDQHPTNITLVLYCSSTSCSQSARVANRLVTQFQRPSVKYMTGGYQEYQQIEASKNTSPPTK